MHIAQNKARIKACVVRTTTVESASTESTVTGAIACATNAACEPSWEDTDTGG
jgi:hypothetical protein